MRNRARASVLLFAFVAALAPTLAAQGWSTVGADAARSALSSADGPSVKHAAWGTSLNAIVSQQAFTDGDTVATARMLDINDVANGTWLVAHSISTGALLWQKQLPPDAAAWRNHSVAFRDGNVYATRAGNEQAGFLYALRASDGLIVWQSQAKLKISTTESPGYAPNGDVVFKGDN